MRWVGRRKRVVGMGPAYSSSRRKPYGGQGNFRRPSIIHADAWPWPGQDWIYLISVRAIGPAVQTCHPSPWRTAGPKWVYAKAASSARETSAGTTVKSRCRSGRFRGFGPVMVPATTRCGRPRASEMSLKKL